MLVPVLVLIVAVELLGVAGGARAERAAPAGRIQVYVMPDTQAWAWNEGGRSLETWRSVAKALCRERERFAMVLHTGDMVDRPRLDPREWENARSVMQELDACGMPYAIAFGNHDFDNQPTPQGDTGGRGDRAWKDLLGALAYQPLAWAPSGRSALHALAPGWFVVSADLYPSPADLAWLTTEIEARPGARFVWLHHHCVKATGVASDECRRVFGEHPAIRIAVSGHWVGTTRDGWRRVHRSAAPALIALYQNYQHVPSLASWGVVIELDPASGGLCVWSEDLLSGETRHPGAPSWVAGGVAPGPPRRCFEGS